MGEAVTEAVRVHIRDVRQSAALADHLIDAAVGDASAFAEPEPVRRRVWMLVYDSQVPIERDRGLAANY